MRAALETSSNLNYFMTNAFYDAKLLYYLKVILTYCTYFVSRGENVHSIYVYRVFLGFNYCTITFY